jgi:hypothetical protein
MFEPLDGPSVHGTLTVGTGTVVEARVGAAPFTDRKVLTMQPSNRVYVFFGSGTIPSVSDVMNYGFVQFKDALHSYEVGERQSVYLLSVSGTITVRIAERA